MAFNNTTLSMSLPPLHPSVYLATGIYLTVVGIIATIGNLTVISVILSSKRLRVKPHNVLILNLAVADLAISFTGYPLTTISGYRGRWDFGEGLCDATAFASFFFSLISIDTLLVICIYRYVIVCRSDLAPYLTLSLTRNFLCLIWGHALFWAGLPILGWGKYGLEPFGTSCSIAWGDTEYSNVTYIVSTLIMCYVIHVGIMGRLYTKIALKARSLTYGQQMTDRRLNTRDNAVWMQKQKIDRNVTLMCFASTSMFILVWTPYAIISAIYTLFPNMPVAVTTLPTMFAKAGCMINPIVYFITNANFRSAWIRYFRINMHRTNQSVTPIPNAKTKYDETTMDGIYLGTTTAVVQLDTTVF